MLIREKKLVFSYKNEQDFLVILLRGTLLLNKLLFKEKQRMKRDSGIRDFRKGFCSKKERDSLESPVYLVGEAGFEPATFGFGGRHSIQLSYPPVCDFL